MAWVEDVQKWEGNLENVIDEADEQVAYLGRCLDKVAKSKECKKREEEEFLLAKKTERRASIWKEKGGADFETESSRPCHCKASQRKPREVAQVSDHEIQPKIWHDFLSETNSKCKSI